jgi:hypothetical protein
MRAYVCVYERAQRRRVHADISPHRVPAWTQESVGRGSAAQIKKQKTTRLFLTRKAGC